MPCAGMILARSNTLNVMAIISSYDHTIKRIQ